MKTCTVCKVSKDITAFNWKNKSKGLRQSTCRNCTKEQVNGSRKNADGSIKKKYIYPVQIKARKQTIAIWFQEKKKNLQCSACGFNHPAALDFHHLVSTSKEFEVAFMVHGGYAKDRIEAEIEKCIVLCSNCHRIKHYNDRAGIV